MPAFPTGLAGTLAEVAESARSESGSPGLGISVFTATDVILERGFGHRDREAGLPVTPETVFGVASITKSFTALTALALQERGLLSIEDEVGRYLPFERLWSAGAPARLHHFLSHSSGLPPTPTMTWLRHASQANDPVAAAPTLAETKLTLVPGVMGMPGTPARSLTDVDAQAAAIPDDDAERRIAPLASRVASFGGLSSWLDAHALPLAAPGGLYSYSNDAFCLSGGIIEQVAGVPYARAVEREVLTPLGMRRSCFGLEGVLADPDHATVYARDAGGAVVRSPAWQTTGVMQAGGMLKSSLADLRVYVRHLMAGTGRVRELAEPRIVSGPGATYGLGLARRDDYHGLTLVSHGGSLKGVSSAIGYSPQLGVGFAILSNLEGVPAEQLFVKLVNACAGLPIGTVPYDPAPAAATPEELQPVLGDYLSGEPYGRTRLYLSDAGELRAEVGWPPLDVPAFMAGQDEVALVYPARKVAARVLRDGSGKVWGLQSGRVMRRL